MSDTQTIGLTKVDRDLLLRGLRIVRSTVMLEIREPSADVVKDRREQLEQIKSLVEQLDGTRSADATVHV